MRIVGKVTIFIVFLLLVAGAIGVACNYLAIRHGRMLSPPPGHFYAVGGYTMHLYCSGSGTPTVALDGGLGSDWINCLPRRLQEYGRYEASVACRPEYEVSWLGETDDFEKSADEVRNTAFGELPVIIISQDPDRPKPAWSAGDIAANPIWAAMQEDLKRVSTHSYRIIARGSGHHVEIDRPDVIIIAVRQLILTVRGQLSETPSYGSTVIR